MSRPARGTEGLPSHTKTGPPKNEATAVPSEKTLIALTAPLRGATYTTFVSPLVPDTELSSLVTPVPSGMEVLNVGIDPELSSLVTPVPSEVEVLNVDTDPELGSLVTPVLSEVEVLNVDTDPELGSLVTPVLSEVEVLNVDTECLNMKVLGDDGPEWVSHLPLAICGKLEQEVTLVYKGAEFLNIKNALPSILIPLLVQHSLNFTLTHTYKQCCTGTASPYAPRVGTVLQLE